jgi:hypothetical protein
VHADLEDRIPERWRNQYRVLLSGRCDHRQGAGNVEDGTHRIAGGIRAESKSGAAQCATPLPLTAEGQVYCRTESPTPQLDPTSSRLTPNLSTRLL